jgi:hypothetical protein
MKVLPSGHRAPAGGRPTFVDQFHITRRSMDTYDTGLIAASSNNGGDRIMQ